MLEAAIELGRVSLGSATDEASLAEQAGYTVKLVDGESTNIKITTEQDFNVSKALLGIRGFGIGIREVPSTEPATTCIALKLAGASLLEAWKYRTRRALSAIPTPMCCVMR